MTSLMTSSRNNLYRYLGAKYLANEAIDSGMVTTDSLKKLAYGLSIAHAPDDVT